MCIICVEFQKQLITINEARGILSEMKSGLDSKHLIEIEDMFRDDQEYDDA